MKKIIVSILMVLIGGTFILSYSLDAQGNYIADIYGGSYENADRYSLFITSLFFIIINALFSLLSFVFRSKYKSWFITINYILFTLIIIASIVFIVGIEI